MSATSLSFLERLADLRDDEAWRQMNDLYAPLIRAWLHRLQVPEQDADDVAQEVLKAVVGGLPRFRHNRRTARSGRGSGGSP